MPRISPPSDIEAHAIEHAPPTAAAHFVEAEIAHRENGRAGAGHGIPASERDLSPDHGGNDRVQRKTFDRRGQHALAVAQHGDAIGESDDLVQTVRRVDDRDARLRQLPHDLEQGLAFRARKRGRRLVHDQDPRVQRQRLGDLDQLLFAYPELARMRRCASISMPSRFKSALAALMIRRWSTKAPRISGSRPRKIFSAAVNSGTRFNSW